jgi:hypothetical protein
VNDVEQLTMIKFPVPRNMPKDKVLPLWPVNFKAITDSKRAVCK